MRNSMNASTVRAMSPTTAGPLAAAPVTRQSTKTSVSQSSASAHSKRPDNPKRSSSQSPTNAAHTAQRQQQPALPGRAGRYVLNARQQPQVATTASQKARVVLLWLRTFQVLTGAITSGATGYQFYNSVIVRKGADSDVNWGIVLATMAGAVITLLLATFWLLLTIRQALRATACFAACCCHNERPYTADFWSDVLVTGFWTAAFVVFCVQRPFLVHGLIVSAVQATLGAANAFCTWRLRSNVTLEQLLTPDLPPPGLA